MVFGVLEIVLIVRCIYVDKLWQLFNFFLHVKLYMGVRIR